MKVISTYWLLFRDKFFRIYCPTNIYLYKGKNRNTRKMCEICSKLAIKTPEQRQ